MLRLASARSGPLARPLGYGKRAPTEEVTRISLEQSDARRPLDLGDTISYLHLILQTLGGPAFVHGPLR